MPNRIQLKRTKGWRKPDGAVVVSRPSKWGNPFSAANIPDKRYAQQLAVNRYAQWLFVTKDGSKIRKEALGLRGKDLCCWCKPWFPCHADVLLKIANAD